MRITQIMKGEGDEAFGYPVDNLCFTCQHLNRENPVTCEAFPDGIPNVIIMGIYDHTQPYDVQGVSDQGITYDKLLDK